VVSAAFYPFSGFTAATELSDRAMRWNTRPFGMTSIDLALQTAADTGLAHLGVPVKFPDGWKAHQSFIAHLAKFRVLK